MDGWMDGSIVVKATRLGGAEKQYNVSVSVGFVFVSLSLSLSLFVREV